MFPETKMDDVQWAALMATVKDIQGWFPDGAVFIGGIAVYAYVASNEASASMAATTHDADLMISVSDYADLRDLEVLTPNRRLGKQQFVKNDFEFDVYVQGQSDLVIPVDEAVAHSRLVNGLRVACPEHLIILKMKAFEDRKGTPKGAKDEDDLVRILLVTGQFDATPLARLTDDMLDGLRKIVEGEGPVRLSNGNLHQARIVRDIVRQKLALLEQAHALNYGVTAEP